jgi:DDE superfamily endonuclease
MYYFGKKKAFTLKTQMVTDGAHHIVLISTSVPGAMHDKKLSDEVQTLERLLYARSCVECEVTVQICKYIVILSFFLLYLPSK